jgi:hypothetical protein
MAASSRIRESGGFPTYGSDYLDLRSFQLLDSVIPARVMICQSSGNVSHLHDKDWQMGLSGLIDDGMIENFMNLRHLFIAGPIGFVFLAESRELRIFRLYSESNSLQK